MSHDVLSRATRALRDSTHGRDDDRVDATWRRISHDLRVRRRRRRWSLVMALEIVGLCVVVGASAGMLTHVIRSKTSEGIFGSPPPSPAARRRDRRPRPAERALPVAPAAADFPPVEAPPPPPLAAPPVPVALEAAVPRPKKVLRRVAVTGTPPLSGAPAPIPEAVDPESLYRQAHQAHFVERDYGAALAGWERYLRVAPAGALALEARYNRAIALMRLDRTGEAAEALRPFADGEYGSYRRAESAALLDELTARQPP